MTEEINTKSQSKKMIISMLFAIIFLVGMIYSVIKLVEFVLNHLRQLNPNVSIAIITVCGTLIVSLISVLIAKHYEHRVEIHKEQHSKKVIVYENFMNNWFDVFFAEKLGKERPSEKDFAIKFTPFISQLITWGSDEVIKSFIDFRNKAIVTENEKKGPLEMFLTFEQLLINIRKDLGHSCRKIKKGDLLKLIITDYDPSKLAAK